MQENNETESTSKRDYDQGHEFDTVKSQLRPYPFLSFFGDGMELFKLSIVNMLLNIITLGLYYPWSKAAKLKYTYSHTEFKKSRFQFHGTGKEMFKGFIKLYAGIIIFYALIFYAAVNNYEKMSAVVVIVFYILIIAILPLAIHGGLRYRLSRSSWRSIRFGYRGKLGELYKIFGLGVLLSVLTCGIYSFWFTMDLYKYIYKNIRFGDVEMRYTGEGSDYFILNIKGMILTAVTCYIYGFWFAKDIFEYDIQNTEFIQNGKSIKLSTNVTGMDFVELLIINMLLLVVTLGLATPWVICRTIEFYFRHTLMVGDIDENALKQTEEKYTDATGEDFLDQSDMDLGILDF